jgi:hypothetical protein
MIAGTARALTAKLEAATPRERAGLAVLAAIAALTAAVYGMEWASANVAAASTAAQTARDLEARQTLFADEAYRGRVAESAGDVWRWSRTADTFAGEEMLAEVEALTAQAGFNNARVTAGEQSEARGRVSTLAIAVSADFDWNSFLAFLEAIEGSELSFVVQSIDVSEEEGAQRLALVLAVPLINADEAR